MIDRTSDRRLHQHLLTSASALNTQGLCMFKGTPQVHPVSELTVALVETFQLLLTGSSFDRAVTQTR